MEIQPPLPPTTERNFPPTKVQFSLKWLMIVVTAVGVLLAASTGGALFAVPLAVFLRCILPTVLLVCAIYSRGDFQAFAVGAFVPFIPVLTNDFGSSSISSLFAALIGQIFFSGICGAVAVAVRRWIVSRGLGPGEPR
jgi:hypothetical protein